MTFRQLSEPRERDGGGEGSGLTIPLDTTKVQISRDFPNFITLISYKKDRTTRLTIESAWGILHGRFEEVLRHAQLFG